MKVYYNEIDKKKCAALKALMKDGHISKGDIDDRPIEDVKFPDVSGYERAHFFAGFGGWEIALKMAGWPAGREVWTGSCPCQPFSPSGNKQGTMDSRHLLPMWLNLIEKCKPAEIFGEQVPGAIDKGWLDEAFANLEAKNYACAAMVFPALVVGSSCERERLYFVASSVGQRLPGSGERHESIDTKADTFREASGLVNAVQRNTLPFLCGGHVGVQQGICHIINHGIGDAIAPWQAAQYIQAYRECVT